MKFRLSLSAALLVLVSQSASAEPEYLNSGQILPTTLPFSEAVKVDGTLYLSGQIGNISGTLELVEGGIASETPQVMENIKTALEAHGYAMSDLVKCTVFLADMSEWGAFNAIYATYFPVGRFPARSALGSTGLAFNARVEVECIAAR